MSDRHYEVGYGRPPRATRFQKGQSGNPKGRPRGSLNLVSALERELSQKVTIKENGRTRAITKFEAAVKQLVNKAASGDGKAIQFLVNLLSISNGGAVPEDTKAKPTEADRLAMLSLLRRLQPDPTPIPPKEESHEPQL